MEKRWNILNYNEVKVVELQSTLGINRNLCKILTQRGIESYEEARNFFRPSLDMLHDPWLMKDMDKAVNRIREANNRKEKLLIFGDYDVDGTTAVACLFQFLKEFYPYNLIEFYIPDRYREGYGVSKQGIDFASQQGISVIVCLDCGIKSTDLIAYALTLGIEFIICDHHLPDNILPPAVAILNPKQKGCEYPYKELCGCGVGFKFMMALSREFSIETDKVYKYLELVAIAIAADIVPMTGENRLMAYFGLQQINTAPSPGIKALISLGLFKKKLTITNVVFVIAPRVNAAGRMDDGKKAVQLFLEKDPVKAMEFAEMLHSDNSDRKNADNMITEEALGILQASESLIRRKSSVVYKDHWHKGVVGIVASRLIEHYYRPTVVLTKSGNIVSGSARSVAGFDLYEAIYECREHLLAFGGHFAAAGLSLLPENIEAFSNKFDEVVSATIEERLLIPEMIIDAEITFSEIRQGFYNIIHQMEPFGPQNMRPVFIAKNVKDTGYSKILKECHIRFVVKQHDLIFNGIGFNMHEKFNLIRSNMPFDIVFSIGENEWNGNTTLQLIVFDIRPSE